MTYLTELYSDGMQALEDTPLSFVDTVAALERMVQHLSMAKEIAIDLEHHHYRSFQGFTCLIQMSTREEDFIVDPLALRAHLGAALTPIFANTKVATSSVLFPVLIHLSLTSANICQFHY